MGKIIRHHHERWDGKGYPDGLAGKGIPEASRLLAVVDAFDAMTSVRPYRPAMDTEEAAQRVRQNIGTQFDPEWGEMFLDFFRCGAIG